MESFIYIKEKLYVARIKLYIGFLTFLAYIESVTVNFKRKNALTYDRINGLFIRNYIKKKKRY